MIYKALGLEWIMHMSYAELSHVV